MDGLKFIAAVLETGSIETLRGVTGDLFMDGERPVFDFVSQHYRRYAQLPAFETVEEHTSITLPPITEQVQYYLRRLYDRKLYADISPEFTRLRELLKVNNMDAVREQLSLMRAMSRENNPDEDVRDIAQAGRGVLTAYDHAAQNPGLSGVPAGWPTLDELTGGYQPGDLVTWIARMKMGKTYLMLKQALYAWEQGYNVLFTTMEMTITQIARRHAGLLSGVNPDYIRKGRLSIWAERRLRSTIANMQHADRFTLYAGGFSKKVEDVELLAQEFDPDILFIDGMSLLRPSGRRNLARLERIPEILDEIKRITIMQNRPIVGSAQFARGAGNKGREGTLENIGLSDTFATHSSLVLAIREGRPPHQTDRRVIDVLAGREGEGGELEINYQFNPMNFDEVSPEQQAAEGVDLDWMG